MKTKNNLNNLQTFLVPAIATAQYYRHWLYKYFIYTDGIKLFAEKGGASWLIDHIALFIARNLPDELYFINVFVHNNQAFIKVYTYSTHNPVYKMTIEYTDLEETKIPYKFKMNIYTNEQGKKSCILCLPSED